ncbi:MAG TPA: response regulator [Opitutaceae bacterium]|nr:response regulator [Lacunisphaera sp.]HWA10419.1 response regulator [Opitutaceae bacterium]
MKRTLEILSAEDHKMYADLVEAIFVKAGHHVATVPNGREALEMVRQAPGRFDLVVTDHQMPELNGEGLVVWLRQNNFAGRIIVHAAALTTPLVQRYRSLSVDHVVTKGHETEQLLPLTESLFA